MAINLLDILKQVFGDNFASVASRFLGESEGNTKSAITAMLPALLAAVVQKGSSTEGSAGLLNLLNSPQVDSNLTSNISQLLGGGQATAGNMITAGTSMLNSLLGAKASPLTSSVSSLSGLSGASVSKLLAMAMPMIMGTLKKLVADHGLNAGGLMSMLGNQAPSLQSALDPRIGQAINLKLPGVGQAASAAANAAEGGANKAMPWIIGLIALIILVWLFRSCSASNTAQKAAEATKDAAATAAQKTAAAFRSVELPGGAKLNVPPGGFIDSLVVFLSKPDWVSGKSFALDNVNFETSSTNLTQASGEQMSQLASVLKAYPNVIVLIEGHTDNTGDPAANKKLSEDRAAAVKAVLVGMGLPADHVNSAGWGQEKPIASNDTEEGRAKNRRVEITLSK
jgi:outer membrane protein OmpA-like peptidoglycan-associated protein